MQSGKCCERSQISWVVRTCFSRIVDEHDAVHPGPHSGALREVLGLTVEEFHPLPVGQRVRPATADRPYLTGDVRAGTAVAAGAEPVWTYADEPAAGRVHITRHRLGAGTAWNVRSRLAAAGLDAVRVRAAADAGIAPREQLPRDVEVVWRGGEDGTFAFVINHSGAVARVPLIRQGTELATVERADDPFAVPVGAVREVCLDN